VNRKGFVIPVAFIALVLFAILGMSVMITGSSDYSQTSKIYYGTKATAVAVSIHEELQCVLYKVFSAPIPLKNPVLGDFAEKAVEIRKKLLSEVKEKVKASPNEPVTILDLTITVAGSGSGSSVNGTDWIPNSAQVANATGVQIHLAEVKFYGFRRPNLTGEKTWQNDKQYYRCPYGILDYNPDGREQNKDNINPLDGTVDEIPDPGTGEDGNNPKKEVKAIKDYIGYYVIRIITSCSRPGGSPVKREHVYNHDVKLVNIAPLAREFAVFSYTSTDPTVRTIPAEYGQEDLNKGGGLKIYPNRWGRIYLRGPYLMETEGWASGTGGFFPWNHVDEKEVKDINPIEDGLVRPTVANTYPLYKKISDDPKKNIRTDWWGWAFLPSQRAPTLIDSIGYDEPARPLTGESGSNKIMDMVNKLTHHREALTKIKSMIWDDALASADAAPAIRLTSVNDMFVEESRWLCSSKNADIHNRAFSFIGDPVDGAYTVQSAQNNANTPDPPKADEYRFSMYRGLYGQWVHPDVDTSQSTAEIEDSEEGETNGENNGAVAVSDSKAPVFNVLRPFWTSTKDWGNLKDDEPETDDPKLYAIHAEGMILGKFGAASFKKKENFWSYGYETKALDGKTTKNYVFPYALRWESAHKQGTFAFLLRGMGSALLMVGGGLIGGGLIGPTVSNFFGRAYTLGAEKYFDKKQEGENFAFDLNKANEIDSYFPPGYRTLDRLATRRYRRLENLIPEERNKIPIKLDGILWCDDLNTERGFKYFGRGMIISPGMNLDAGAEEKPVIKCPILPQMSLTEGDTDKMVVDLKSLWNDDPNAKTEDGTEIEVNPNFLTIATTRQDLHNNFKANRSVIFKTDEEQPNSGYVAASLFCEHGISAKPNNNIHVVGNYVCGLVNKQQIPGDGDDPTDQSNIYISYDQRFYPERWQLEDDSTPEDIKYTEGDQGQREELDEESSVKEIPSPSSQFESYGFYSFNLSRKLCGVRFGLSHK